MTDDINKILKDYHHSGMELVKSMIELEIDSNQATAKEKTARQEAKTQLIKLIEDEKRKARMDEVRHTKTYNQNGLIRFEKLNQRLKQLKTLGGGE